MPPSLPLEISEIQIVPMKPRDGLVAFTSFVLNGQFYIGDIAIYTRLNGGYRLVYPARMLPNGKRINCVHPINRDVGEAVEQAIVSKFEDLTRVPEHVMTTDGGCADERAHRA